MEQDSSSDNGSAASVTRGAGPGRCTWMISTRTAQVTTSGSTTETRVTTDQMEYELASRYIALWDYESNTSKQGESLTAR